MNKWLCPLLLLLFLSYGLSAQDFPTPIVGNDLVKSGVTNASPGKGLSFEYFLHPKFDLQNDLPGEGKGNIVNSKKFLEAKIKIPVANSDKFRMLVGLSHTYEKYQFDQISSENNFLFRAIDDVALRRTRGNLILFYALNSKNYIATRIEASYNGNYSGIVDFDKRYAVYRASFLYGIKKQANKEVAFGLTYNNSFTRTLFLPFIVWNKTFNDKWGIETVLPLKISMRRNFKHNDLLLFGTDYWSSAYNMDITPTGQGVAEDFIFKSSAMHTFVEYQKRLASEWTWISLKTGWAYNFDSKFIRTSSDTNINAFPSNSFFISLGFFVSPPDSVR